MKENAFRQLAGVRRIGSLLPHSTYEEGKLHSMDLEQSKNSGVF